MAQNTPLFIQVAKEGNSKLISLLLQLPVHAACLVWDRAVTLQSAHAFVEILLLEYWAKFKLVTLLSAGVGVQFPITTVCREKDWC